jgi:hypothetical protein
VGKWIVGLLKRQEISINSKSLCGKRFLATVLGAVDILGIR